MERKEKIELVIWIVLLIVLFILFYQFLKVKEIKTSEIVMVSFPNQKNLTGKKIVMVIAYQDFRDIEYFVPKEILKNAGAEVIVASNKKGTALGADGGQVDVDLLVEEINPQNFDAVIFVGGPGCLKNLDNEASYKLINQTVSEGKVLGSICISPVILAKSGVLKEKKATVWSSLLDKSGIKILEENGAIYVPEGVVVDGKIITANGPDSARDFGKKIVELLTSD